MQTPPDPRSRATWPSDRIRARRTLLSALACGTFRLAGTCTDASGRRDFGVESRGVLEKDLTVVNRNAAGEVVPTPLAPLAEDFVRSDDTEDGAQDLIFGTAYPTLFDGIDCVAATDAELIAHVTGRIAGSALHQHAGAIRGFTDL